MKFYILLTLAMITWGVSWVFGKKLSHMAETEVIIFWRFLATFLAYIPLVFLFKEKFMINKGAYKFVALGTITMFLYNKLFFDGLRLGLAGAGGVLVTTLNPIINYLLVVIFSKQQLHLKEFLGLILGFSGGMIILQIWKINLNDLFQSGNLFFLIASFVWALLSIISHKSKDTISPILFSLYIYGFTSFIDLFFAFPYNLLKVLDFPMEFWLYIGYISVISTSFGTTIYFYATGKLGSHKASSFIFLVPATALFSSWIAFGEEPQISTIIGGGLAVLSVYLIHSKK